MKIIFSTSLLLVVFLVLVAESVRPEFHSHRHHRPRRPIGKAASKKIYIKYKNGTIVTDELLTRVRKKNQLYQRKASTSTRSEFLSIVTSHNQRSDCHQKTCFPPQGNLLIGRKNRLHATSTCGLQNPELFCVLGGGSMRGSPTTTPLPRHQTSIPRELIPILMENNVIKNSQCEVCDSREPFDLVENQLSHRIENVIKYYRDSKDEDETNELKWWQSENDLDHVNVQFNLEAEFILTRLVVKFKNYPPQIMVLERSQDFGRSWQVLALYATNCGDAFDEDSYEESSSSSDPFVYNNKPVCISRYSKFESRELVYRPLIYGLMRRGGKHRNHQHSVDPFVLAKHSKFTNLRLKFKQLLKLGDHLIRHNDYEDRSFSQYYYAISEMQIMGFCSCNGHASKCTRAPGHDYDSDATSFMVHAKCECEHNTDGLNCERCLPMYNDLPWQEASRPLSSSSSSPTTSPVFECHKCNCNEHAQTCHFDHRVFELSGRVSGGVCDNCTHNTEGKNCERCLPNFFHDPALPFTHPNACKPCDCDPRGTVTKNPICTHKHCECKLNVKGDRCDQCQVGSFNLSAENEDGCQRCDCNLAGTVGNLGCNNQTGVCMDCKLNVIGSRCDQCRVGYYGDLTDEQNMIGCQPCSCHIAASYSNECAQPNGQCDCIPNAMGRDCSAIAPGYFCADLDHIILEAELDATKVADTHSSHIYYYNGDNYTIFAQTGGQIEGKRYTGNGFLKVYNEETIKFKFRHEYVSGLYDLVLRYDAMSEYKIKKDKDDWRLDMRVVKLSSDEDSTKRHDSSGGKSCAEIKPHQLDDLDGFIKIDKAFNAQVIIGEYCLGENGWYEVTLRFRFHEEGNTRRARSTYYSARDIPTILVDSMVISPNFEWILPNRFEKLSYQYDKLLECRENYISLPQIRSPECDKLICQLTTRAFGLLPCKCDPIGSYNNTCASIGGKCDCKPNIVNRQCDKCASNTWDFSPHGCRLCNCNAYGSKSNKCNTQTGECDCLNELIVGRECDKCLTGHFGHPKCYKCDCNGFSSSCAHDSGICFDCKSNTEGPHCETCKSGYYGMPLKGILCKPCMCPGLNGNNFAETCYYEMSQESEDITVFANNLAAVNILISSGRQKCVCMPGYTGFKCEQCANGFYGNPIEPGGQCRPCNCNGHADLSSPFNPVCDSRTGECLNCMHNTDGFNCEKCKAGFYRSSDGRKCIACECDPRGTMGNSKQNCDPDTGVCKCLPNVVGRRCNQCKDTYWGLESESGCMECECDLHGTFNHSASCVEKTGQCECSFGRGGRRCNECPFGYWGSPRTGCKKCDCSAERSITTQCDQTTGECACLPGLIGSRCDRCDRGTTGTAPNCKFCGECFFTWDCSVEKLKGQLAELESKATSIYSGFLITNKTISSDFNSQTLTIRAKIDDIRLMFNNDPSTKEYQQLARFQERVNNLKATIAKTTENYKNKISMVERLTESGLIIDGYKETLSHYMNETHRLLRVVFSIKESFVNGAQYSIMSSKKQSDQASEELEKALAKFDIEMSEAIRHLRNTSAKFNSSSLEHQLLEDTKRFKDPGEQALDQKLAELNLIFCGSSSLDCDSQCGSFICSTDCGLKADNLSEECSSGFMWSYLRTTSLNNTFRQIHSTNEDSLRRRLNEANRERNLFKKSHEFVLDLNHTVSHKHATLDLQNKILDDLLAQIENQSYYHHSSQMRVRSNCDSVNAMELDLSEEDLNRNIDEIVALQETINSPAALFLDLETARRSLAAHRDVDHIVNSAKIDLSNSTLGQLENETDSVKHRIHESKSLLKDLTENNELVEKIQFDVGFTLGRVNYNLSQMQERVDLINEMVSLESSSRKFNYDAGSRDLLDQTLNEIRKRIGLSIKKVEDLSDRFEQVMNRLNVKLSSEQGVDETDELEESEDKVANFFALFELKVKIAEKRDQLVKKFKLISDYETKRARTKKEIETLKNELIKWQQIAKQIKSDLLSKHNFALNCQ